MKPLIFDTFLYNGDEILSLRLDYLYESVDCFVLIEALQTHSGVRKDGYLIDAALPLLWKYLDKLVVVKIAEFPPRPPRFNLSSNDNPDDWWREFFQREYCKPHIARIAGGRPYVVICADIDEIPHRDTFADVDDLYRRTTEPVFLDMEFFYYNFHWRKPYRWRQGFLKNDVGLGQANLTNYRIAHDTANHVRSGWHCSFFMSRANMIRKITSTIHTEFDRPDFKADQHIAHCLATGQDVFNRGSDEDCVRSEVVPAEFAAFQRMLDVVQR